MSEQKWQIGQDVVIERRLPVLKIERVTPRGQAIVRGRTFEMSGYERGPSRYAVDRLEAYTPEIAAEIALVERGSKADRELFGALDKATTWARRALSARGYYVPEASDVEKAERLVAAIEALLGEETKP